MRNIVISLAVPSILALSACQQPAAAEKVEDAAAAQAVAQAKAYDTQVDNMPAPIATQAKEKGGTTDSGTAITARSAAGAP